jgi:hypothetical protein
MKDDDILDYEDWMAWERESRRVHVQDRTGLVIASAIVPSEPMSWPLQVHEWIADLGWAVCAEIASARTVLFVMALCFASLAACGGFLRSLAQHAPAQSVGPGSAASALVAP